MQITDGSFAELDAIFMVIDGDERVLLLLNLPNLQQQVSVAGQYRQGPVAGLR